MKSREPGAGLEHDLLELEERHQLRRRVLLEVRPDQQLEHQEGHVHRDAAVDDVRDVRVVEPRERLGLLDERGEDPLALGVARPGERVGLGDLEHEHALRTRLANEPHAADAALAERLEQLVALDDLGLLLLRRGRRRRRALHRATHAALDERARHRAERGEPHLEHRELPLPDRARDEGGHAGRVLARGTPERVVGALLGRGVERLDGVGQSAVEALGREHEVETHRLEVGPGPRGGREAREPRRQSLERLRELGVLGVERRERLLRRLPPGAVLGARRDGGADVVGEGAALLERTVGDHRERRGDLQEHRRPVDHQRPPRREGPEPSHVVDLAERRAARRVDQAPEHRRERGLHARGQLARPIREAVELAEPQARVVRGAAASRPEVAVLAERVERVSTEAKREHLDRGVGLGVAGPRLTALSDHVEQLGRRPCDELPRLLEIRLLDRIADRSRRELRAPEAKRERASAALERVHGRGAVAERPRAERDAARLLERRRQRLGEARGARVGLLVVVLRREAHEVLEPELEVQRIALRRVDRVADGHHLEPPTPLAERVGLHPPRHVAQLAQRRLDRVLLGPAPPEGAEAPRERARGDRAPVPGEDPLCEPVPEIPLLEEEVGRRRGHGCQRVRIGIRRVDDRGELRLVDLDALGRERREGRGRALAQERRVAERPVHQRRFELLHRARQAPERAGGVHPDERLRVQEQRLQDLERAPDELRVRGGRHAAHAHLEAAGRQHAAAQRAVRRSRDDRVEGLGRAPDPGAQLRHGERARAGLPEQDLHARRRARVLRQPELVPRTDQRRTRERVDERALDDAVAGDVNDVVLHVLLRGGDGEQARQARIAARGVGRAPDEDDPPRIGAEERTEVVHAVLRASQRRQRAIDDVGGRRGLRRDRDGAVEAARAPARVQPVRERGGARQRRGQGRERFGDLRRQHLADPKRTPRATRAERSADPAGGEAESAC